MFIAVAKSFFELIKSEISEVSESRLKLLAHPSLKLAIFINSLFIDSQQDPFPRSMTPSVSAKREFERKKNNKQSTNRIFNPK
jgi:hypothetical protein